MILILLIKMKKGLKGGPEPENFTQPIVAKHYREYKLKSYDKIFLISKLCVCVCVERESE